MLFGKYTNNIFLSKYIVANLHHKNKKPTFVKEN